MNNTSVLNKKSTITKQLQLYVWRFGIKRPDDEREVAYSHTVIASTEHEARSSLDDYICYFAGKRPASPEEVRQHQ